MLKIRFFTAICTVVLASNVIASVQSDRKNDLVKSKITLENSWNPKGDESYSVFLMCYNQRPAKGRHITQVESGEQELWVKAVVEHGMTSSKKIFVTLLNASLTSSEGYLINYKKHDNDISVWVEDRASGEIVSDVQRGKLRRPLTAPYSVRRRQCQSSTV